MQEIQHPLQLAIEELKKMPTVDIKGKSYTQVSTRVAVFRKHFPNASITTNIIYDDPQRVVVQATISIDDKIVSTGHSEEIRGEGWINTTSALENAETSSIGRALAGLSLSGNEYASSFEVVNAQEQQPPQYSQSNQQPQQQTQTHQQPPQQHLPQDYSSLYNLGLTIIEQGDNLIVIGDDIFSKRDSIKACGFRWDGASKLWYKTIEQQAA